MPSLLIGRFNFAYNIGMVAFVIKSWVLSPSTSRERAHNHGYSFGADCCSKSIGRGILREVRYDKSNRLESCSRDPIGYEGSEWNLYEYVSSTPTLLSDPTGKVPPIAIAGGILGGGGVVGLYCLTFIQKSKNPYFSDKEDPWGFRRHCFFNCCVQSLSGPPVAVVPFGFPTMPPLVGLEVAEFFGDVWDYGLKDATYNVVGDTLSNAKGCIIGKVKSTAPFLLPSCYEGCK